MKKEQCISNPIFGEVRKALAEGFSPAEVAWQLACSENLVDRLLEVAVALDRADQDPERAKTACLMVTQHEVQKVSGNLPHTWHHYEHVRGSRT